MLYFLIFFAISLFISSIPLHSFLEIHRCSKGQSISRVHTENCTIDKQSPHVKFLLFFSIRFEFQVIGKGCEGSGVIRDLMRRVYVTVTEIQT